MNDGLTLKCRRALKILFTHNPIGTSIGIFLGAVLAGIYGFLTPVLKSTLGAFFNLERLNWFFWISLSVFGFNYKAYRKKDSIDPLIVRSLNLVDEAIEKGAISKAQGRLEYLRLIRSAVDSVTLTQEAKKESKEGAD